MRLGESIRQGEKVGGLEGAACLVGRGAVDVRVATGLAVRAGSSVVSVNGVKEGIEDAELVFGKMVIALVLLDLLRVE